MRQRGDAAAHHGHDHHRGLGATKHPLAHVSQGVLTRRSGEASPALPIKRIE